MSASPATARGRMRIPAPALRRRSGAPSIEYSLLQTATLCLLALGVVMVFSASSTTSLLGESGDGAYYLKRTLAFGAIGLLAMRILSIRGLSLLHAATPVLLAVSLALLVLVLVPGFGLEANGARRWLAVGPLQFQPSELAKLALVLYGAGLLAARPRIAGNPRETVPFLLVVALACGLIVLEPDLGTALVISFAVAALLVAAGAKLRHLALIAAAVALLALVAIVIEPYRQERVLGFLNPGGDGEGSGFQGAQATIALGSGGIFGVGLGESVQKAFYLPEAHTDMIAAVIGEEVGFVGLAVLIGLYGLFAFAGFRIAQRARDRYGKLLAAGLTAMVVVQASINLLAVTGLAPLTGVTLPLVSYGNSSLVITLAAAGLILNVGSGATVGGQAPAERRRRGGARSDRGRLRVVDGSHGKAPTKRRSTRARGKGRDSGGRHGRSRRAGARRRRRASR